MTVPAGSLARVTLVGELYGVRQMTSLYVRNQSTLSDAQWRSDAPACAASFWNLVVEWITNDFQLLQYGAMLMNLSVPRPVILSANGVRGNLQLVGVSRFHYIPLTFNARSLDGTKQWRRTMRLFGPAQGMINRGMFSQEYIQDLELAVRNWYGNNSTVPPSGVNENWEVVVPHLDKSVTPNVWRSNLVKNCYASGIPKTLGSRAYAN